MSNSERLTRIRTLDGESNIVYGNYLKITDNELKAVVEKLYEYEEIGTPKEFERAVEGRTELLCACAELQQSNMQLQKENRKLREDKTE